MCFTFKSKRRKLELSFLKTVLKIVFCMKIFIWNASRLWLYLNHQFMFEFWAKNRNNNKFTFTEIYCLLMILFYGYRESLSLQQKSRKGAWVLELDSIHKPTTAVKPLYGTASLSSLTDESQCTDFLYAHNSSTVAVGPHEQPSSGIPPKLGV